jgi:hypothetical protein
VLVAAAVLFVALAGLLAGILSFATDRGTFQVQTDDPNIEVKVEKAGLKLRDRKTGREYQVRPGEQKLPSGDYDLEVTDTTAGLQFDTRTFTIKRDGHAVVKVWFEKKKPAVAADWPREVAALPAAKQVEAVAARLKERNPGFDGKVTHKIEDGVVTQLGFVTDNVTDIAPVRALTGLQALRCQGSEPGTGQLVDLSPLVGLKLTHLNCQRTKVSDLSSLKGMPLTGLDCSHTSVADLSPLKDAKLAELRCGSTNVDDLSPLQGMKLTVLDCGQTKVSDLSPLKDMKLTSLICWGTKVSDLSPLQGMKLEELTCWKTQIADLSPLQGMPLTLLHCGYSPVSDLSPLQGRPLTDLDCTSTKVSDLAPLRA